MIAVCVDKAILTGRGKGVDYASFLRSFRLILLDERQYTGKDVVLIIEINTEKNTCDLRILSLLVTAVDGRGLPRP